MSLSASRLKQNSVWILINVPLCKQVETEYSLDSDQYPFASRLKQNSGWILINVCASRLNSKCRLDSDQCLCKQVELKHSLGPDQMSLQAG